MSKLSVRDLEVSGKKVLVRVDFNVPFDGDGHITDATRIEAAIPTIEYLLKNNAAVILMSHLGKSAFEASSKLTLAPCAKFLSGRLKNRLIMAPDCIGHQVETMADQLLPGEVLLLENLRLHRAEEFPDEDPDFAKQLASYGNCYVNDAFGTAHRKHSSTYYVPKFFPGKAAAGLLMEKELQFLTQLLENPKKPFCVLLGGAKVSSKIGVIKSLVNKVDALLIGGAMSYTFFYALGKKIGSSLYEKEMKGVALEIIEECKKKNVRLVLPVDCVATDKCSHEGKPQVIDMSGEGIPDGLQGVDIGPKTIELFDSVLKTAGTILWNGPMGVFEIKKFAIGTESMAKTLAQSKAVTVVGGGDSVAALNAIDLEDQITHVSTGGGSTLEFLEFGTLPGVEALSEARPGAALRELL
jgi:phosphoglycerate kinase